MVQVQNPDGSYSPATPLGWQEEHNWLARLIFWLRRVEHCNNREGQRRVRRTRDSEISGELLYDAWVLIANAYHGNWDEDQEWKAAAVRWRDKWHAMLTTEQSR